MKKISREETSRNEKAGKLKRLSKFNFQEEDCQDKPRKVSYRKWCIFMTPAYPRGLIECSQKTGRTPIGRLSYDIRTFFRSQFPGPYRSCRWEKFSLVTTSCANQYGPGTLHRYKDPQVSDAGLPAIRQVWRGFSCLFHLRTHVMGGNDPYETFQGSY